jgi:hypothetical protein
MPCLIGCLALSAPRLAIVLVAIFSNYIGRAYQSMVWPTLGFFFMPMTTLAYAWSMNSKGSVSGVQFVVTLVAAMLDLGLVGGGVMSRKRRLIGP